MLLVIGALNFNLAICKFSVILVRICTLLLFRSWQVDLTNVHFKYILKILILQHFKKLWRLAVTRAGITEVLLGSHRILVIFN